MIDREPVVITSVHPLQGHEGTIVTLKGSGFASHIRNNCIVIGGMGACARAEPNSTPTELKVRIGPVAKEAQGDLLMWPGTGSDLYTEEISLGATSLRFSEAALFRNGAPVASAGINFQLVKASPNAFAGRLEQSVRYGIDLGGHEKGAVLKVSFPADLSFSTKTSVDVCIVLKEPTLAVDFTAEFSGHAADPEACLRLVAKSIAVNARLMGETVLADVARNVDTGEFDLYVTKPYLTNGMVTVRFNR
ncbi:IPT/TIG domain-containing protein [Paraburkholderia aspalathi]|uniref:IPT/TIG domain-containing protein n=1 Tax=Paraburkholderia aspalathi TaxID=1324617 RepID=UPI0038BC8EA3